MEDDPGSDVQEPVLSANEGPPTASTPSGSGEPPCETFEQGAPDATHTGPTTPLAVVAGIVGAVRRHRVASAVLVGVVVVVLVGGGLWWRHSRDTAERPGWARSARSAVDGYLRAVAAGRADDAVAYLHQPPADRTFLTDEVLARSRELGPLTGIVVADGKPGRYGGMESVTAQFRIGSDATTSTFTATHVGGYWFVDTPQVDVHADEGYRQPASGLGAQIRVNGVPLLAGTIAVFPGRYQLTCDHPFVELDDQFTVAADSRTSWGEAEPTEVRVALRLTDEATRTIGEAASAQLATCLAQTAFDTECGFLVDAYVKPDRVSDPTTISWSLDGTSADLPPPGAKLQRVYLRNDYTMGLSSIAVPIETKVRCTWTDVAGQPESFDVYFSPNYYVADATDPDHIVITFVYEF